MRRTKFSLTLDDTATLLDILVNGVCTSKYVMMVTQVYVQECVIERELKGSAGPVMEANRKDLMQPPSKYFELRSWFELL